MSVLEKFKLVELITSRTDSVATFMNGNQIKFNAATFVDLGYPEYIQLFVEEKGKQFAIKACKADAPQAIKFSKPAGEQRYPIKISCAPAANAVRRVMQWAPEESWNVPGAIFGEEKVIIYSLEQAYDGEGSFGTHYQNPKSDRLSKDENRRTDRAGGEHLRPLDRHAA